MHMLMFFLTVEEKQGLIFTVFSRQIPASCFTVAATTEDGCKSTVHPYIMKHLQEYTKEKTLRAQRENTAFSIVDDKIQMLSYEYDRSCIVQNIHMMKTSI